MGSYNNFNICVNLNFEVKGISNIIRLFTIVDDFRYYCVMSINEVYQLFYHYY